MTPVKQCLKQIRLEQTQAKHQDNPQQAMLDALEDEYYLEFFDKESERKKYEVFRKH